MGIYLASWLLALLSAAGVSANELADDVVITLALDAPLRRPDALEEVVDEELVRLLLRGGASSNGGGGVEQHESGAPAGR